ncbi:hypothetical protein B0H66DRAFT_618442 [Apodospora peruviana]|uniref:ubiquitinyl hydrolase 1 n=1 Tax=Apodospora peruviana TaxID=516989 RepID=A0AAE0IAM3_9PEZI|nr:hypothetical protein B0H66DRAFT_618442 [Apodospora peruviana]
MLVQEREMTGYENGGRLASRVIKDWFAGRLVGGPREDLQEWRCTALRDPSRQFADTGSDHDFMIIPSQTYDPTNDPERRGNILLSCMCRFCRYHFAFKISPGECGLVLGRPMHHFVSTATKYFENVVVDDPDQPETKRYPVQGQAYYTCSACPQSINVEITLPRLKTEWLRMIGSEARVREALRAAKEEDPERFQDINQEKAELYATGSLSTLNKYLQNVLTDDGTGPRKRISFRNKTFLVQFGPACEPLFRYLGFEVEYDEERDENFWLPPKLPPSEGKTVLGSLRAFYEDARSEVQNLLEEHPPQGEAVVKPISAARNRLEEVLACHNHQNRLIRPVRDDELDALRVLGAPADAEDDLLKYAYLRQKETDPANKHRYLEALGKIAAHRDVDLQLFVFEQQDNDTAQAKAQQQTASTASSDTPIDKAYAHFGLTRSCSEAPSYFINVYNVYRDQSPAQRAAHRTALLQIGKDRNSDEILAEVYKTKMEPAEACTFLSVEPSWPMDTIVMFAQTLLSEDTDLELIIMALDAISLSRPSDDPARAAFEVVFSEIRSQRTVHQSILVNTNEPSGQEPASMELPVGLGNLRNTCYLNSILQYFYSVKAVRNLVLNLDLPPMEATEQNLQNLLSGTSSSDLETGRAFVGHEFARELVTLFRELHTSGDSSITPRQRLANAALLRPEKVRPLSEEPAPVVSPKNADAPPLPPRAGENNEPKVTIDSLLEPSETASNVSSQTLVNQTEEDPSYVVVDHDTSKVDVSAPMDIEMTNEEPSSHPTSAPANETEARRSKLSVEELAAELDKPNVGSDQMDVDEVMGNAIDHLRAAFKVAHVGRSDSGPDPIEEAFFSTFIDNRKKVGERTWNRTTRSDRWVTAYPSKTGTRDLYSALENSFDLEPLPPDLLSFTTIDRAAPNFHICIQRSDGVSKNVNPIAIPETLYLDRFLHSGDTDSEAFQAKKRSWDIKTRLNEAVPIDFNDFLKEEEAKSKAPASSLVLVKPNAGDGGKPTFDADDVDQYLAQEDFSVPSYDDESGWSVLSPAIKDLFAKHNVAEPEVDMSPSTKAAVQASQTGEVTTISPASLEEFWDTFHEAESSDKSQLTQEYKDLFNSMKEVAYRLHAVVCHAGATASAGHYWVWIHDFEQDVWRKYNDTRVSVHPQEFVFHELNTKGEPYYLAYVRAKDIENLVGVPRRQVTIDPQLQQRTPLAAAGGDAQMADAYETPEAQHVEHVGQATVEQVEDVNMNTDNY